MQARKGFSVRRFEKKVLVPNATKKKKGMGLESWQTRKMELKRERSNLKVWSFR